MKFSNNPNNIKLSDQVVLYNDGQTFKVIPLKIMLKYHVLHDSYYYQNNNETNELTIYLCPRTLFGVVYFGKFISMNKYNNNNLMIKNDEVEITPINFDNNIKHIDLELMTMRNAISFHPDCVYLDEELFNNSTDQKVNITGTLGYILEYKSRKTLQSKFAVFSAINNICVTPDCMFNIVKNGFKKYIDSNSKAIKEKRVSIYPCLLEFWKKDSKMIN